MRVFVAGATGAIGRRLVPQLRAAGHEVTGTHVRPDHAEPLRAMGATPVRLDVLDAKAVEQAVATARPEAILHEATSLLGASFGRSLDRTFTATNRLRTRGTDNLLAAAKASHVPRFIGQSFAPYRYERRGGPVKTEEDPLDERVPKTARETFGAMKHTEEAVLRAGGIVLRYGLFYGDAYLADMIRGGKMPILGDTGIFSMVHLDDAAAATVLALKTKGPAIYNIVDDEPAPFKESLPVLAAALHAKPPRRIPPWLARIVIGGAATEMMTHARGASNEKAKRELGWKLKYPSWRQGFLAAYARR